MSSRRARRYGRRPCRIVLVHGGPGAAGSLAPVARVLARRHSVLEPWQRAHTIASQVAELVRAVERDADPPVVLVGHSWGAWLSLLAAREHPELVRTLVLVGSGPFRARAAREVRRRRRARLSEAEWAEYVALGRLLAGSGGGDRVAAMRRLGELSEISDSYRPIAHRSVPVRLDPVALREIGDEASEMRRSGALARALRRLRVPVVVVHGSHDPHPVEGVVGPLRSAGLDPKVVLLSRCGHEPWWERSARDAFFRALEREIREALREDGPTRPRSRRGSQRRSRTKGASRPR